MTENKMLKKSYIAMTLGSTIGLVASFIQMIDKITLLKNSDAALVCNISDKLNCSSVLNASQASVLGPPNALISTVMFTFFLAISLDGLFGGLLSKKMKIITQFLSIFVLAFGFWFLMQSIFVIGSLCIYCIFNTFGLLLINANWLKLNYKYLKTSKKTARFIERLVKNNYDILIWLIVAIFIIASAIIKFL